MGVKNIQYCPGYTVPETGKMVYCPLWEICYRCCDCKKSRKLKQKGIRNDSFFAYDSQEKHCPFYLDAVQWKVIENISTW